MSHYFFNLCRIVIANYQLKQKMKRYAVIAAMNTAINVLLEVAKSFAHKFRKDLEASCGDVSPMGKLWKYSQRPDAIKTPQFIQRLQYMDANTGSSMRAIGERCPVVRGHNSQCDRREHSVIHDEERAVHVDTHARTTLLRGKWLLNKWKHPEELGKLYLFF